MTTKILKCDNLDGWVEEIAALSEAKCNIVEADLCPVQLMLAKVHKVAFKTIYLSTNLLPVWKKFYENLNTEVRLIPHDVHTCLRDFELDKEEWVVMEQLCKILKVLKEATLFFSVSTPNIAHVIPVMDIMNDQLTNTTLNTCILHPQYKLQYFKNAGWQDSWIATAKEAITLASHLNKKQTSTRNTWSLAEEVAAVGVAFNTTIGDTHHEFSGLRELDPPYSLPTVNISSLSQNPSPPLFAATDIELTIKWGISLIDKLSMGGGHKLHSNKTNPLPVPINRGITYAQDIDSQFRE
ncbi:hypothetical protein BDQ17DRAFT_1326513 [Cyathus striatus]|nr:hypothetical protein BDQ17DRAFT_1326513 [Cyathus striatus]